VKLRVPTGVELRDAQADALERFNKSLLQRLIVSLPTGVGKTILGLVQANSTGGRTLWLAHRDELITQPFETVQKKFPELKAGIVKAGTNDYRERLVIGSVQTLCRKERLGQVLSAGKFQLVVVDEVHHVRAATYRKILDEVGAMTIGGPRVLGLTATVERSDRKTLFPVMEDVCYHLPLPKAIELGYLVPMIPIQMPLGVDLSGIKRSVSADGTAELDEKQVDAEFERAKAAEGVAKAVYQHALCDQTVVFCCSVNQAKRTADELKKLGIKAEAVWGEMPTARRTAILEALRKREIQAVCNMQLLCLDEETEILTDSGWTSIDEMTPLHKVANFDKATGDVYFEEPKEIVRRPRGENERMVSLETPRRSVRVTEGHRMLYRTTRGGEWLKTAARDLVGRRIELPVSTVTSPRAATAPQEITQLEEAQRSALIRGNSWNLRTREGYSFDESKIEAARRIDAKHSLRRKDPHELTTDECALIGFWVGDGSANYPARSGVEYTLCQGVDWPKIVGWVDKTLSSVGVDFTRRINTSGNAFVWSIPRGTGSGSQERRGLYSLEPYLDKNISDLIWGLNETQFDAFLRGLWIADGNHGQDIDHPTRRGLCVSSVNKIAMDRLQAIACCRGYRASISTRSNGPGHIIHVLGFSKIRHHSMGGTFSFEAIWHPERVWCVRTSSSNLITRRRGTVTFMGNTEGWDDPGISCVVVARPTLSQLQWIQMAGRGLRLAPELGKRSCKVIDMVDASSLGLVTAGAISKQMDEFTESESWGGGGTGEDLGQDFEIELVRRFLKRARVEPVCVRGTYFQEVEPGQLWVTVAKNGRPIFVKRVFSQERQGWVVELDGQSQTSVLSQGDAMGAASIGINEWGGPAVPGSVEWTAWERTVQVEAAKKVEVTEPAASGVADNPQR